MISLLLLSSLITLTHAQVNQANSSEPFVCTPQQCLQGHNSLNAGVTISTPFNGSTEQFTLLPGTYTSSSFPSLYNSTSSNVTNPSPFSSSKSTSQNSPGFTSTGSLSTSSQSFTVSVEPGLITYPSAYYEGTSTFHPLPNSTLNSTSTEFSSLLLTAPQDSYAIVSTPGSSRIVVWESIPDVSTLGFSGSVQKGELAELRNTGCPGDGGECGIGGKCSSNGTCVCRTGFTGNDCGDCLPGFYGKECSEQCRGGCSTCDDGIAGSGLCLDPPSHANLILPSDCNCLNGICSGSTSTATCDCNAGWTRGSNGTQCASCSDGYYMSSSGDCLGTCQTCQSGLQPLSSSPTTCTTATTASSNGTFITCPTRTFFSSSSQDCVACDSMCETCYGEGSGKCLECRTPNVLLEGKCVAIDQKSGVCDGRSSERTKGGNAGWVYDNEKGVCDALPSKCTRGGIDSFSSSSKRDQLTCSACLPGSYLVNGVCQDSCPSGSTVSEDGSSCQACDSSCSSCLPSLPSFCTSCSTSSNLLLNGTCLSTSSCPTGFFSSTSSPLALPMNSTSITPTTSCLACHPSCETCSDTSTNCLSCPASTPVLSKSAQGGGESRCLSTCSSQHVFYDSKKQECVDCHEDCATCYGSSKDQCLSCSSSTQKVVNGKCLDTTDGCRIIEGFGVCLEDLVSVEARTTAAKEEEKEGWKLPWWVILLIIVLVLTLVIGGVWWFRKREQKRRREHTKRFANELGNKEVDKKLAALPNSVAYPPLPRSYSSSPPTPLDLSRSSPSPSSPHAREITQEVPLTPRFILEDPSSPMSPSPSSSFGSAHRRPPPAPASNRWSASSYATTAAGGLHEVGATTRERLFTTAAGNTLVVNSKNPFFRKAS
ncbi:hypothetical protein JCM5353_002232 [Sporobolomyces roseus]